MRRTRRICCASFSPKTATCGCTRLMTLSTTVSTPSKWPGRVTPSRTLPSSAGRDAHPRHPAGIHLVTLRREDHLHPHARQERDVRVERPRVRLVVLAGAELERVDEDRHDDLVGELACGAHQLEVPLVERPHRHDERSGARRCAASCRALEEGCCELCARPDDERCAGRLVVRATRPDRPGRGRRLADGPHPSSVGAPGSGPSMTSSRA